jgi:hypothetical protein
VCLFRPQELIKCTSVKAVSERGNKKPLGFLFLVQQKPIVLNLNFQKNRKFQIKNMYKKLDPRNEFM